MRSAGGREPVVDTGSDAGPDSAGSDGRRADHAGPPGPTRGAGGRPRRSPPSRSRSEPEAEARTRLEDEAPVVPVSPEPVLEMLAAREGVRGPGADEPDDGDSGRRRGVVAIAVASFVAAVIGGAAAFVGLSQWDDSAQAPATGGPSRRARA